MGELNWNYHNTMDQASFIELDNALGSKFKQKCLRNLMAGFVSGTLGRREDHPHYDDQSKIRQIPDGMTLLQYNLPFEIDTFYRFIQVRNKLGQFHRFLGSLANGPYECYLYDLEYFAFLETGQEEIEEFGFPNSVVREVFEIPLDLINVEGVKTVGLYFNIQNSVFADIQMIIGNSLVDLRNACESLNFDADLNNAVFVFDPLKYDLKYPFV